jgi:hypothetical protein
MAHTPLPTLQTMRVKLHPASDLFMQGRRYATLVSFPTHRSPYYRVIFDGMLDVVRLSTVEVLEIFTVTVTS